MFGLESLEARFVLDASGTGTLPDYVVNPTLATSPAELAEAAAYRDVHGPGLLTGTGPLGKIGFDLSLAYEDYYYGSGSDIAGMPTGSGNVTYANSDLQILNNSIAFDAVPSGGIAALQTSLIAIGATGLQSASNEISAWIPVSDLASLANLSDLSYARALYKPVVRTGSVESQGDAAINAVAARANYDVTGAGVTVGVISDSFNTSGNGSEAADVASGDLPAAGVDVLGDMPDGTDEGRGMAQIIHDVAPGAAIDFDTGGTGDVTLAGAIDALQAAGANIIVDDVGPPDEAFFQDSLASQAIDNVVAEGVSYFSAAGNDANQSYESAFVPSTVKGPAGGVLMNFATSGAAVTQQEITIPAFDSLDLNFQWNQPFASLGGAGATSQVNVYVLDSSGQIVGSGNDPVVGGDAQQLLEYTAGATNQNFYLEFELVSGPAPTQIKYILDDDGGGATIDTNPTNSSTDFGHTNAAGAIGVAAAPYYETPAFGVSPPELEDFSSLSGTPIYIDDSGNYLQTPVVRQSLSVTGPDGVNTSFFGDQGDMLPDNPGEFNFFGTSAAAPHVAAVAALMMQASGGPSSLTESQIRTALDSSATTITVRTNNFNTSESIPITGTTNGYNYWAGYGLVNANTAVGDVAKVSFSISNVTQSSGASGQTAFVFTVSTPLAPATAQSVAYATADGTATVASNDYAAASGTLTFAPGQTSQTITVLVNGSRQVSPDLYFYVNLSNPSSGAVLAVSKGTGTIVYDSHIPPVAANDSASVYENNPATIDILAIDTSSDSTINPATVAIVTQPGHGTLSVNATTGAVTYTPAANYVGGDSFKYTVEDAEGAVSNVATVSVTVLKAIPPVAQNARINTPINTPLSIDLLDYVTAPQNNLDPTSFKILTSPQFGSATLGAQGVVLYTPKAGFTGGDSFTYDVSSTAGAVSNAGTITVVTGPVGSLSGYAYVDANDNGVKDPDEDGIGNVTITLVQTSGNDPFTTSVTTASDGSYTFGVLPPGVYTISQTQPAFFEAGKNTPGAITPAGPSAAGQFANITLPASVNAAGYDFGELGLKAPFVEAYLTRKVFFASANQNPAALDLGTGSVWFSFDAGINGTLSAVAAANGSGTVQLQLFNGNVQPLATSNASSVSSLLNYAGSAGQPYFLEVTGSSPAASLSYSVSAADPWHNSALPVDVEGTGQLTPLDLLMEISLINTLGGGPLADKQIPAGVYPDVLGTGALQPLDVLAIITALNAAARSPSGAGAAGSSGGSDTSWSSYPSGGPSPIDATSAYLSTVGAGGSAPSTGVSTTLASIVSSPATVPAVSPATSSSLTPSAVDAVMTSGVAGSGSGGSGAASSTATSGSGGARKLDSAAIGSPLADDDLFA